LALASPRRVGIAGTMAIICDVSSLRIWTTCGVESGSASSKTYVPAASVLPGILTGSENVSVVRSSQT
jgi:hypothetical protein